MYAVWRWRKKKMNKETSSASHCVSVVVMQECRMRREEKTCCCCYPPICTTIIMIMSNHRPSHLQTPIPFPPSHTTNVSLVEQRLVLTGWVKSLQQHFSTPFYFRWSMLWCTSLFLVRKFLKPLSTSACQVLYPVTATWPWLFYNTQPSLIRCAMQTQRQSQIA